MHRLYTDGACQPNPGNGGWAYILIAPDGSEYEASGFWSDTTNNRMELLAVLNGLKYCSQTQIKNILICSDSKYLINGIRDWSKKWRNKDWVKSDGKPVLNIDIWKQIRNLADELELEFEQIKGHTGNVYNEKVDKLAIGAIKKYVS